MVMGQKDVAKNSEQRYRPEGLEKTPHKWQDLDFENMCPAQGTGEGEEREGDTESEAGSRL